MPSELKVTIERIKSVENHPNADRLDLIEVLGWKCVAQKGVYVVGDRVVYFPIDSILPNEVEERIFGPDSKVKLSKSRVKTVKLRGAISQGLAVPAGLFFAGKKVKTGQDVTKELGIKKHQPPQGKNPNSQFQGTRRKHHPDFLKYTHLNRLENYGDAWKPDGMMIVTEKIHGTNFRCGWVRHQPKGLWDKLVKYVAEHSVWPDLWDKWEFVYGSHNVQLSESGRSSNVYLGAVKKYDLKRKLREYAELNDESIVIYGEVYGEGIQKNYGYSVPKDSRELALFDIRLEGQYIGWNGVRQLSLGMSVPHVPVIHMGFVTRSSLDEMRSGPSLVDANQKVREGIVVRTEEETTTYFGRGVLKYINPEYLLLKGNTEWS